MYHNNWRDVASSNSDEAALPPPAPIFPYLVCATRVHVAAGSWHLPLSPDGGLEPVGSSVYPEDVARRAAAAKLVGNRKAVVRFALRGVGLPGVPGVAAELADPNAKPNEDFRAPVDAALRWVMSCTVANRYS